MHVCVFVSYFLLTFCCWKSLYFATVELYRCLVFTVDNCFMCRAVVDKAQPFCAVILHVSVIPRARAQHYSLGRKSKGTKAKSGGRVIGEVRQPPPHQVGGLGSAVSPQRVSGQSRHRPKVFHYFQHSGLPFLTLL